MIKTSVVVKVVNENEVDEGGLLRYSSTREMTRINDEGERHRMEKQSRTKRDTSVVEDIKVRGGDRVYSRLEQSPQACSKNLVGNDGAEGRARVGQVGIEGNC
jgi:hypothetical protein